ncbi:hypothetical protein SHM_28240 [Spiroplasma ixodetis]|uniref:Uncharacterized protein n=1 Tax=Spiroplasma ixodetis TaxID=2141 RepID=A0ABM8BZ32_9MOLU|nr:hypothetical protein SHM_28240 [Spiroplasma ixodetis]
MISLGYNFINISKILIAIRKSPVGKLQIFSKISSLILKLKNELLVIIFLSLITFLHY